MTPNLIYGEYGTQQDDIVVGSDAGESMKGFNGDDILIGNGGVDWYDGGLGSDTVAYGGPYAVPTTERVIASLADSAINDGAARGERYVSIENLIGTRFDDELTGNAEDNILEGGGGKDKLDGGSGGSDTASYFGAAYWVNAWLDPTGWYLNSADAAGDTYTGIENLIGSQYDDWLHGDNGDNILIGGRGRDMLDGRRGIDTASYITSSGGVHARLARPDDNGGDAIGDTYYGIENLAGSHYGDYLEGDANPNVLTGHRGADILNGGSGIDTASYWDATEGVQAGLEYRADFYYQRLGADALGDSFIGIENLTGSKYDDGLWGDSGVNTLRGEDGKDYLDGGAGDDQLYGGNGSDTLTGGPGWDVLDGGAPGNSPGALLDTASYRSAASGVTADMVYNGGWVYVLSAGSLGQLVWEQVWKNGVNTGDATGDQYVSIENLTGSFYADRLLGNDDANVIYGEPAFNDGVADTQQGDTLDGRGGNDTLEGRDGNDTLVGGLGKDQLSGGTGADTFVYRSAAESGTGLTRDTIDSFRVGEGDKIDLSAIDARSATPENDAFVYVGAQSSTYTGSAGQVWLTGNIVRAQIDGMPGVDLEIELTGLPVQDQPLLGNAFVL